MTRKQGFEIRRTEDRLSARAAVCLLIVATVTALTMTGRVGESRAGGVSAAGASLVENSPTLLADAGTLSFNAELDATSPPTPCPAGTDSSVECFARTGTGVIRGLGTVDESYAYLLDNKAVGCDPPTNVRQLPATGSLSVPGKGEIEFAFSVGGTGCFVRGTSALFGEEIFTITGGSGSYAGASGGGTIADVSYGHPTWRGTDRWTGRLVVQGLDFDLTPPVLSGAHSTTVRVPRRLKRVRIAYTVAARDTVDGTRPVSCRPKSRSWFVIGRTRVRCTAADTSGNVGTATFLVTVKRRQ